MILTDRDKEILQALCLKVRLICLPQVAASWWADTRTAQDTARRRLAVLMAAGYLLRCRVLASPLPPLRKPVVAWQPGEAEPDFGHIAWRLQSRWSDGPRLTTVYVATKRATHIFGGKARGRLKREFQATHDLGVTHMYLHFRRKRPDAAQLWIGEDILAPYRRRQKLPDAVLAEQPDQSPLLVLEFGGAYDKRRVEAFHGDCRDRQLPYELW